MTPADPYVADRSEAEARFNALLLELADELEREASWRPSEAGFLRQAGALAEAAKLELEAEVFRAVAAYLTAKALRPEETAAIETGEPP